MGTRPKKKVVRACGPVYCAPMASAILKFHTATATESTVNASHVVWPAFLFCVKAPQIPNKPPISAAMHKTITIVRACWTASVSKLHPHGPRGGCSKHVACAPYGKDKAHGATNKYNTAHRHEDSKSGDGKNKATSPTKPRATYSNATNRRNSREVRVWFSGNSRTLAGCSSAGTLSR